MNDLVSELELSLQAGISAPRKRLGDLLIDAGLLSPSQLVDALAEHLRLSVPLGQVLVSNGFITETQLFNTLARQWRWRRARFDRQPPDPQLCSIIDPKLCLEFECVPWTTRKGLVIIACPSPEHFDRAETYFQDQFGIVLPAAASRGEIFEALRGLYPDEMAHMAAHFLPEENSCRRLANGGITRGLIAGSTIFLLLLTFIAFPAATFVAFCWLAIGLAILAALLKFTAFVAHFTKSDTQQPAVISSSPTLSIMVPLHREPDIASALVSRLSRLDYPRALLDILLVVEENDDVTLKALSSDNIPAWMRIVVVPEGEPKTKPRALNHALRFCRGEIIGIYDAEDAPAPDQINQVVAAFRASPPDVACVQGVLEFYNPKDNWLARCFTLDYAAWFRVILPGWSRLGLPVPLGGTTLFLRRDVIEELHGWDAHNVTEDADLGLRLVRAGYRTVLISSVTGEEANCHGWRWIRQRSRWIKGYMVTYWAHMRHPVQFMREIGLWPFFGFQVLFLGTCLHFLTAPLLWSFWLGVLGLPHAFFTLMPEAVMLSVGLGFLTAEALGLVILVAAAIKAKRKFLIPWAATMPLYHLLAVPAGMKAFYEFIRAPVFWDKTDHGHSLEHTRQSPLADQEPSCSASDFKRVTKAVEICDFNAS